MNYETPPEEDFTDSLAAAAEEKIQYKANEVDQLARTDFNVLAGLLMPDVFEYLWPKFYLVAFSIIANAAVKSRDFTKLAFGFPRGFAKTTFVKLCVCWILIFTNKKFILILGKTAGKAEDILADVWMMLKEPNVMTLWGSPFTIVEQDRLDKKKFSWRGRAITLAALGKGGDVRGIVTKHERPDVMIFDDIQDRDEAESEVEAKKLYNWFFGTALKACSPKGCLFLFLGNMYPTEWSLLKKLKKLRAWIKFITGCITVKGESLWEELQPLNQLLREYEEDKDAGMEAIFLAEKMNLEDASISQYLDPTKVQNWNFETDYFASGRFIVIDPATDKTRSDDIAIGGFDIFDGKMGLFELDVGHFSPKDMIKRAIVMAYKIGASAIFVEDIAYQHSIMFWAGEVLREYKLENAGFNFIPINAKGATKNSRILTSFKALQAGEWLIHDKIRDQYFSQALQFNPLKQNNRDDVIDLPTLAVHALKDHPGAIGTLLGREVNKLEGTQEIVLYNSCC